MICRKLASAPLLVSLAAATGCSSAPDPMLGTYCDHSSVMEFDGQGTIALLADDGREMQGRYEYDP